MDWVDKLRAWVAGPDLSGLAENIATEQRSTIWQRVEHRVDGLALAEARGYVRIKAKDIVAASVATVMLGDTRLTRAAQRELEILTMEAVLRQAIADLINARQLATADQSFLRRAA